MARTVAFLLGKPPKPGTIIAETIATLEPADIRCAVLLPHERQIEAAALREADLVVHRGLGEPDQPLLRTLADHGIPLCNPWPAVERLRDRATLAQALVSTGVSSPHARVVLTWEDVLTEREAREVVVKAVTGPGRGASALSSPLPRTAPMPGPYLVEDRIPHDGIDRKLYVAGDWVAGLLKRSTLHAAHTSDGEPFVLDADLDDLARRATSGLGLHLAGVDVVIGPAGPVVVDVNAFPGYRGVVGATAAVAGHLLQHLEAARDDPMLR
jgi:ribosomal protein S6--L-glutamate ligase